VKSVACLITERDGLKICIRERSLFVVRKQEKVIELDCSGPETC